MKLRWRGQAHQGRSLAKGSSPGLRHRIIYRRTGGERTWLGTEGGREPVILQTFRRPWGFYLSVRVGGGRRRVYFGPRFG